MLSLVAHTALSPQPVRCRRASVSIVFAISSVAVLGIAGLAIDYAVWNQARSQMSLAATVAALDAAKVASASILAGNAQATAISAGQAAGRQWFTAESGAPYETNQITPTALVTINGGTTTATVSFTAKVRSVFGGLLFGITSYNNTGTASATISSSPYVNIDFMVDNSSSMLIGANDSDMLTMMEYSACYITQAVTQASTGGAFNGYGNSFGGQTYNGTIPYPIPNSSPPWDASVTASAMASQNNQDLFTPAPTCKGQLPTISNGYNTAGQKVNGPGGYYLAGQPCAFACHDGGAAAGFGNDLFALARTKGVTLRYDVVKAALNAVIAQMQADDTALRNLKTGIYTFNYSLTPVYPGPGGAEAGDSWTSAIAAVGTKPTGGGQIEPGYQPDDFSGGASASHSDTDFPDSMNSLASILTAAGDGSTAATPRKVLILLTDGLQDYNSNTQLGPFDTTKCDLFKGLGYTIFVLYTPYNPLMHVAYLNLLKTTGGLTLPYVVEQTGAGTDQRALQQCASDPNNDFIVASNTASITAALNKFLLAAINAPARLTQ